MLSQQRQMFERYFHSEAVGGPIKALDAFTAQSLFPRRNISTFKADSLDDYYNAYLNHDLVRQSIDDLIEGATGKGYYTVTGEPAEKTVQERTAYATKGKELVDDFGEHFNLDSYLGNIGRHAVIAGYVPVETRLVEGSVEKCKLKIIHPLTIKEIHTDPQTEQVIDVVQQVGQDKVTIEGKAIAWFCYNPLGNSPIGVSLVRGMINVLNTLNKTTDDVDALLDRYLSPVGIWKMMSGQGRLESFKKAVLERRAGEDIFLDNLTPEEMTKGGLVEFLSIDPRVPFWDYIQMLYERVYSYTRSNNLIFVRNATEASAKKMDEIVGRHVTAIQRFLKRGVERYWFTPLTELNGYGEAPRLVWGQPRTPVAEIQLERFLTACIQNNMFEYEQVEDLFMQMGMKLKPRASKWVPPEKPVTLDPLKPRNGEVAEK